MQSKIIRHPHRRLSSLRNFGRTAYQSSFTRKGQYILAAILIQIVFMILYAIGDSYLDTHALVTYRIPPLYPLPNIGRNTSTRGILSVVFPTHCSHFHSAQLTLASLIAFTEPGTFDELILLTPQKCPFQFESNSTAKLSKLFVNGIRWISDESLLELMTDTNVYKHHFQDWFLSQSQIINKHKLPHSHTWHKQMILKIAISYLIETPFFLILDDDILQISPASLQDFVSVQIQKQPKRTRIIVNENIDVKHKISAIDPKMEMDKNSSIADNKKTKKQENAHYNEDDSWQVSLKCNWVYDYDNWKVPWYLKSAKVLQAEYCLEEDDITFGVTPSVIHTNGMRSVAERMKTLEGMNGVNKDWSEYGAYRIQFCLRKDFYAHHSQNPTSDFKKKLYTRYAKNLLKKNEAIYSVNEVLELMEFQSKDNIFIVLQDGAVPDDIRELAGKRWIEMKKINAVVQEIDDENVFIVENERENVHFFESNFLSAVISNDKIWLQIVLAFNVLIALGYLFHEFHAELWLNITIP